MRNTIRKTRTAVRIPAVLLAAALLTGSLSGCGGGDAPAWSLRPAPEALTGQLELGEGFSEVLRQGGLSLAVNGADMSVRLTDEKRGVVWSTNPEGEALSSALRSQFSLSYYDKNGNYSTMDSYTEAVERNQVKAYKQGDSLFMEYVLGDYALTADSIPQKLSVKRFQHFVDQLPQEKAEQLTGYYKLYESENMVGIRPKGINEFLTVRQLLLEAGYTEEDLIQDNAEFGVTSAAVNRPYFTVVLQYTLNEDGFTLAVPAERLQFSDDYPLYSLTLLENFGRLERSEEGFLLIPDGSGALIHFDKDNVKREKASVAVFGEDLTVTTTAKLAQQVSSERVTLPVFGMADGGEGFLAVIEEGEANAYIEAYRSGGYNAYNAVYPRFLVINKDNVYLEGASSENSKVPQFQRTFFDGAYRVRYILLDEENPTYSAMAGVYREYLVQAGVLKKADNPGLPLVVETLGGVTGYKNFCGISYTGTKAVTTYEQNIEILEAFREKGVSQLELVLTGWFGGGVYHEYPEKVKLIGELGGKKGLQKLLDYTTAQGIALFPDANLMTVYKKGGGFYAPDDASRTLDLNTAKIYTLSYATGQRREADGVIQTESFILSPNKLMGLTQSFLKGLTGYGFRGVSLRSSGSELYADYDRTGGVDRIASQAVSRESLALIAESLDRVMVREGNSYALPYATHILNAAQESSGYLITDEDVPFLQLVLHGYKSLSGRPVNLQSDYHEAVLRAAETGMSLHVQLTYAEAHELKNTDCSENYSSCYKDWLDIIAAAQAEMEERLAPVAGAVMVSHEKLDDGLTRTGYDNGWTVYVNYGAQARTIGGTTIPAMDYAAVKEAA